VARTDQLILSLDLGTSTIKAGLFSLTGAQVALATREQAISFSGPDRAQQSPAITWRLVGEASREVLDGTPPSRVIAVVSTHHRGSVVAIDADGQPLTDLIVWMDRRGLSQIARIKQSIGDESYYLTSGHPIVPVTGVSKVLWLQSQATDTWEAARTIGSPQTLFLRWLGCGEDLVDYSSGSYHFPCDIRQRQWSEEIARELSLPIDKLPRLVAATAVVGQLSGEAANSLGLRRGTPIIAGGGDGQCAAAGAGVVVSGRVLINIGTATGVQVFLPEPAFDANRTLNCAAHVVPHAWEMEGHTQASGITLRWFRDHFPSPNEQGLPTDGYDRLVAEAADAPSGSDGLTFIPTFNGSTAPVIAPEASGALLGLRLSHTRSHVMRSVLEGISLEVRWMVEAMARAGAMIDDVRLAGGGSKNPVWNQIHADVLGRPARAIGQPDAALVGAAMCAAVGVGAYADFHSAADAFVKPGPTYQPDATLKPLYEESLGRYIDLFNRLNKTGR
jgi:xylulokinase